MQHPKASQTNKCKAMFQLFFEAFGKIKNRKKMFDSLRDVITKLKNIFAGIPLMDLRQVKGWNKTFA